MYRLLYDLERLQRACSGFPACMRHPTDSWHRKWSCPKVCKRQPLFASAAQPMRLGDTQRITQLDTDFRRLAKKLDGEFERLAYARHIRLCLID